jgi:aspartyl-tRNA(Asn)/glutamyl-tRNA(Gln) amidotransferase subunit A
MKLYELTAYELHELMKTREISPVEVLDSVMTHVLDAEPVIHAYITLCADDARAAAQTAERAYGDGTAGPLCGIPLAIKDNMCTEGIRTTCGSQILYNFVPPYDSTVAERLKKAGAVIIGKTNMDEFAMGSSCENSGFFNTYNPWKKGSVPGGSSGGSAATVGADGAVLSLGSDTGGSVRLPASFCGVTGMKPTYGRVSRYGLVAFASSLDQIGPITKDTRDCALLMNHISGHDPMDSTSAPLDVPDFTTYLGRGIRGVRVGVPREYFGEGIDPKVRDAVVKAIDVLTGLGASVGDCSLPHTDYAVACYYLIAPAECSSNLARFDGVRFGLHVDGESLEDMMSKTRRQGFGQEVKRRIVLGTYALSAGYYDAYYAKAQKVRTLMRQDFDDAFGHFDVIVCPTSPTVAFMAGDKVDDPLQMYLADMYTIPVNLAGLPAISIPCGFADGLPVGLQIIAPHFQEGQLITIADAYEHATSWRQFKPAL